MNAGRDVALVLSGGGVNGVLLELGFLKRLRESELWPRVGRIFGTSAGALAGTMAALDRLDDLERFMLRLEPEETFRPNRIWRLPLFGLHEYVLPRTIEERLGDPVRIAEQLRDAPIEVVVLVTDLTETSSDGEHAWEATYSSRATEPRRMAEAVVASAAVSALVLPVRVGERIATDGAWVRNFPLGHAYDHPEVQLIVAFRYLPRYPELGAGGLAGFRRRLERFPRIAPIRAFIEDLREAEERAARGEPAHMAEMIARLARVAIMRNTILEERLAGDKDRAVAELESLRRDVCELVREGVGDEGDREALLAAVGGRFARARFPFRHDRRLPRITVHASAGEFTLETGFRSHRPWTVDAKRALIARGYAGAAEELRAAGYG